MIKTITRHAAIVLSLFYAVLFVIDRINNAMAFIDNSITKALLLILAILSIYNAFTDILDERARQRLRARKKARAIKRG